MSQESTSHPLKFQGFKKKMLHSVDAQFVADPRRLISETDCAGHHKFPRSTATGESSGKSAATMNYF